VMPLRVLYRGPICQGTGFGQAAHDYLMAMQTAGIETRIQLTIDGDTEALEGRYAPLAPLIDSQQDPEWPTHVIVHTIPKYAHEFVGKGEYLGVKAAMPPRVKKVCITTWETSEIPKEFVKRIDQAFDLVIVPSTFNEHLFISGGLSADKIRVIPHTFDPAWWFVDTAPRDPDKPYVFYTITVWASRKNPMGLLTAYFTEFEPDENVVLKIVTPNVCKDEIFTLIRAMDVPNTPKVEFLGLRPQRLNDIELRDIHLSSDCYVTVTRGEGWGLGAYEAMLIGNPVIATGYGGLTDFLKYYDRAILLDYLLTPTIIPEIAADKGFDAGTVHIRPMLNAGPCGLNYRQYWAEPDLRGCRVWMRKAFENRWGKDTTQRDELEMIFAYKTVGKRIRRALEML